MTALFVNPAVQAEVPDIALVGATTITSTGEGPVEDSVILVKDGRIVEVGKRADVAISDAYRQIELEGKWVTPGLIDTNVHLILMTVPEFFIKYEDDLEEIAIQSAQVGLKYGMTTMSDTWGPLEPLKRARERINNGEFQASRILIAGNIVGAGGPFSANFMSSWDIRGLTLRYGGWVHPKIQKRINTLWESGVGPEMLAMTPEEAAEAMRDYIAGGVDFVKVSVSGHGMGEVEPLLFSPRVLKAMRDVVREAGIPFQTHTFTVESLRMAIDVEPDLLQHPNVMSIPWTEASEAQKSAIRTMMDEIAEKDIYAALMAIPNLRQMHISERWDSTENDDPWLNQIMENRRIADADESYRRATEGLKEWLDSDVAFTLATDQGPEASDLGPVVWGRLGRAHFDRMEALQDAGVEPMDILIAATRNGANAYKLGDEVGTIEVGKVADLLVLDANPLEDIANLRRILHVIKSGQVVDRGSLPTVKVLQYDPDAPWPE